MIKPVEHSMNLLTFISTTLYTALALGLVYLQETLHKSQIDIPEKYLLFIAVGLTLFGGFASYMFELQQKNKQFKYKDLVSSVTLSGFVALLVGLFASGYVSTPFWLGIILVSAFFKNVILAIIPKAIEEKTNEILHLSPTKKRGDKPSDEK